MPVDPETLPADVEALRAMVLALASTLEAERTERRQIEEQNDRLRHFVRQLQRMQFGRRSERLDPDQLNLALEDVEQARAEAQAVAETADPDLKQRRTGERRKKRASLPPHLPRIEIVVAPESTACPCCRHEMHVIGEDRAERLDIVPARYQVIVTSRPAMAAAPVRGRCCRPPHRPG